MGDIAETLEPRRGSLAPTLIFSIVIAFQFLSRWLESLKKKKGSKSAMEIQLRGEINQLLKEGYVLSSSFKSFIQTVTPKGRSCLGRVEEF